MKLAVISDLHLGRGDGADQFGHQDAEFLTFLDHLEGNFERVVLLGDVYETLASRKPMAQAEELGMIRRAHPEICERFEQDNYTYLHGNHDLVTSHVIGAPTELRLDVDGTRLLFTHGHGYDWFMRHARWVQEWGIWLGSWLGRFGMGALFRALERVDRMVRGASLDPSKCDFQRWAVALAEDRGADVIVTGHTHMGVVAEHGDRMFLNSGSCAEGNFGFLSIDTAAGNYAMNTGW